MTSSARERLEIYGASAASDADLISTLVGCSEEKAAAILAAAGGLASLGRAQVCELERISGVGKASAGRLVAAVELAARVKADASLTAFRKPADIATYLRAKLGREEREHFVLIGIDARQRLKMFQIIAIGSLAQVDVHPREVFRPAVRAGCHSVIVAHNHPSGDAEPSAADADLTGRLVEAGRLLGIPVLDHVVVSATSYVSFAERGLCS